MHCRYLQRQSLPYVSGTALSDCIQQRLQCERADIHSHLALLHLYPFCQYVVHTEDFCRQFGNVFHILCVEHSVYVWHHILCQAHLGTAFYVGKFLACQFHFPCTCLVLGKLQCLLRLAFLYLAAPFHLSCQDEEHYAHRQHQDGYYCEVYVQPVVIRLQFLCSCLLLQVLSCGVHERQVLCSVLHGTLAVAQGTVCQRQALVYRRLPIWQSPGSYPVLLFKECQSLCQRLQSLPVAFLSEQKLCFRSQHIGSLESVAISTEQFQRTVSKFQRQRILLNWFAASSILSPDKVHSPTPVFAYQLTAVRVLHDGGQRLQAVSLKIQVLSSAAYCQHMGQMVKFLQQHRHTVSCQNSTGSQHIHIAAPLCRITGQHHIGFHIL